MNKAHVCTKMLVVFISCLVAGVSFAESDDSHGVSHDTSHDTHSKKHFLGAFAGQLDSGGETETIYGIEYEYKFHPQWGVGVLYEDAKDAHHGDGVHSIIGAIYYHPWRGLRLGVGAGEETVGGDHGHDESLYRIGVAYDFHIAENFGIGVSFNRDYVDSEKASVYGLSLVYAF